MIGDNTDVDDNDTDLTFAVTDGGGGSLFNWLRFSVMCVNRQQAGGREGALALVHI